MKKDKLFKVLSYIGSAFGGALIMFVILLLAVSCSPRSNETKAESDIPKLVLENKRNSYTIDDNGGLLIDLENYEYSTLETLSDYLISKNHNNSGNVSYVSIPTGSYYRFRAVGDESVITTYNITRIESSSYQYNRTLYGSLNGNAYTYFLFTFNQDGIDYGNRGKPVDLYIASASGYFDFTSLYTNPIVYQTYTFLDQFNYNAFAQEDNMSNIQVRMNYPFLNFGEVDTDNLVCTQKVGQFLCGGTNYDTIVTYWNMATTDLYFQLDSGLVQSKLIENTNPYKYFSRMEFTQSYNSATKLLVCQRMHYLDEQGRTIIQQYPTWMNNDYKSLKVLYSDTYYRDVMTMAYNLSYGNGYTDISSNIGLGNVFSLLTMAFSSWASLFTIQIVPGVTIGLLMFLPLIAGIIVLIIWIVKR